MRELQNSNSGPNPRFRRRFGFLASRLWPIGYVNLRETEPASKSSNLSSEASFATPSMEIIDLHCDLLLYLALSPKRTPFDSIARCSTPQLKAGNVTLQTLAIYSETKPHSVLLGSKQLEIFQSLKEKTPDYFLPAIENASAFALETEPLDHVFERFETLLTQITPLYISLTWNGENRFGGGCGSDSGLKKDGEELLHFLNNRGIAIDFSHASDKLARETLNFIDKHKLNLRVIASHSNFRALLDQERNLPDDIAKEIIARKGIIGLNFYGKFLKNPSQLHQMIEYGHKLGGENALAFGADFFCTEDLSTILDNSHGFFDEMSDASTYPSILERVKKEMGLSENYLKSLASENARKFIAGN